MGSNPVQVWIFFQAWKKKLQLLKLLVLLRWSIISSYSRYLGQEHKMKLETGCKIIPVVFLIEFKHTDACSIFFVCYLGVDSEGVAVIWSQILWPYPPVSDSGWTQSCVSSVVGLCLAGTATLIAPSRSFSCINQEKSRFWQICLEAIEEILILNIQESSVVRAG